VPAAAAAAAAAAALGTPGPVVQRQVRSNFVVAAQLPKGEYSGFSSRDDDDERSRIRKECHCHKCANPVVVPPCHHNCHHRRWSTQ
jgi:hypothetical protein